MNTVWIVLPILIVLMFQLGIELDGRSFSEVVRQPIGIVAGLIGQLLLLPLLAFGVGILFDLPPILFLGMILIACCPGGSSSNVFSMLAKGDVALSVTLTALSSIITLFTIPLVMEYATELVSGRSDAVLSLPVGRLLMQNIVLVFLPMALGFVFRYRWPVMAQKTGALLGRCAFPALMLLAALFFVQYADTIVEHFVTMGSACSLLILSAMLGGALLARIFGLQSVVRRTIVIEVGMQNAAQAIAIALSPLIFNSGEMAIPAVIYALLMNVILLTYLQIVRRSAAMS